MKFSLLAAIQVLERNGQIMVPGAGLEPARPQRSGDFKFLAATSNHIPLHLATTKTSITKPIFV